MTKVPGLGDLFKQAQELQERLQRVQQDAAARTVEADAGGGMVVATVNGRLELTRLRIDPALFEQKDREMLEDLIAAAVNRALKQMQDEMASEMSKLTGGLKLPGLG